MKNNTFHPYAIGIFDGINFKSFYITDVKSSEEFILESLRYLIQERYNGSYVWIHNFSGFDAVYLFKYLLHLSSDKQLNPIMRHSKIISLDFNALTEDQNHINLHFRDSLNLLPQSLKNLGKAFYSKVDSPIRILFRENQY